MRYHFITTTKGNVHLAVESNGVMAYGLTAGDKVVSTEPFEATPEEYHALIAKAATHDFVLDRGSRKVSLRQKPQPHKDQLAAGALEMSQDEPTTA